MDSERDVVAANQAFYTAFDNGDIAAMEALWASQHEVACIHPGWSALETRAAVIESWRQILDGARAPSIHCADPRATLAGNMGFVVCRELLSSSELIATNIFVLESGLWKICHHHASPIAQYVVVEPTPPDQIN